jgi:hypothetical protein
MKNKLDLITLVMFGLTAILSFLIGNIVSGLGWTVATMLQMRILFKFSNNGRQKN